MGLQGFDLLRRAVSEIQAGRVDCASSHLEELVSGLDPVEQPGDLLHLMYASALGRYIGNDNNVEINLYLRNYGQLHIDLFNLVGSRLPVAFLAGHIANGILVKQLQNTQEATVLSFGMGTGRQEVALVRELAASPAPPDRLVVVGVDPAGDSLQQARVALDEVARQLGIAIEFHSLVTTAEDMSPSHWAMLRNMPHPLAVNAAFALHHIQELSPNENARDDFLLRLRELKPACLVMCEPDSEHHRRSLEDRFFASWNHFHAVFGMVDSLNLDQSETVAIKTFFGREIDDIVGTASDDARFERHESTQAWCERLVRSGYRLEDIEFRPTASYPGLSIITEPGCVRMGFRTDPILSVICATT
ncbi:GRAS family protein [Streptomyces sp. NPDC058664]|uniref:GRAS family protein n=1 Tax=unclassified Streptomyces TaxID=2593676 RepID=UPI00365946A8